MRLEGENYLLAAKVQTLERRCAKAGREVHGFACQLAQALRTLGASRGGASDGRASQRTERAFATVASVRDGLQRLAAERTTDNGPERGDERRGQPNPAMNLLREENARLRSDLRKSSDSAAQLRRVVDDLEQERAQRESAEAEAAAGAEALRAEGAHTAVLRSEWSAARDEAENLRAQVAELQAERNKLEARLGESRPEAQTPPSARPSDDEMKASRALEVTQNGGTEALCKDAMLWRQRELLIRLLRKDADLEGTLQTLRDEVTRRDVLIHNTKQELQTALQQRVERGREADMTSSPYTPQRAHEDRSDSF